MEVTLARIEEILLRLEQKEEKSVVALSNSIPKRIKPFLKTQLTEMEQSFNQKIQSSIDSSFAVVLPDLMKQTVEQVLKDNTQTIVNRVVKSLNKVISESFQSLFASSIIPAFERGTGEMFRQMDEAFQAGLRERFETTIEAEVKKGMNTVEREVVEIIGKGNKGEEDMMRRIISEQQRGLEERIMRAVDGSRLSLEHQFRHFLHSRPHQEPRSGTPGLQPTGPSHPPKDHRPMYVAQLSQGQYEQAFRHALEEKNINDVAWLCLQLQPSNPSIRLSSFVLLPLLHQLSFSFVGKEHVNAVGVKIKWMQRAAMNLSSSDPLVGRHVPSVCGYVKSCLLSKKGLFVGCEHDFQLLIFVLESLSKP